MDDILGGGEGRNPTGGGGGTGTSREANVPWNTVWTRTMDPVSANPGHVGMLGTMAGNLASALACYVSPCLLKFLTRASQVGSTLYSVQRAFMVQEFS